MSKPKNRKPADLAKAAQAIAPSIVEDIESIREKSLALELPERRQRELARRPNETVCEHARRLAGLEEQKRANEAASREQAFLDSLFPDRFQYTNHGDHTYTICGWRWSYSSFMEYDRLSFTPFDPDNLWNGIRIFGSIRSASNLTSFGSILLDIDERLKDLPVQYPNTLWGFLKRLHRQWMEGL